MKFKKSKLGSLLLPVVALLSAGCSSNRLPPPSSASAPLSPLGIEKYGKLPAVSHVAISPNGEYFAYRRVSAERDAVLVYSIQERKLVNGVDVSSIDPQAVFFNSDDTLILVVSEFKDLKSFREGSDISTAFAYRFHEGELKALISPGQPVGHRASIYPNQTGMGRILGRSVDNEFVFMPAFVKDDKGDRSPNYALLEVPTDGQGKPRIVDHGTVHTTDYFLDDKGNLLARESYEKKNHIHRLESKLSGEWKTVYANETDLIIRTFVGLTEDFESIVFLGYDQESDYRAYYSMSLKDGETKKLSYEQPDRDVANTIGDRNNVTLGVRYSGFTPSYRFFDSELQEKVERIQENFAEHSVRLVDWSADFRDIVVRVEGSSVVGDYFLFSENKKPRLIASSRPGISVEELGVLARVTYKARDGLLIPTLLTIPRSKVDAVKSLPTVVMPHGGPGAHDEIGFDFLAQALASRGYLVVQPQFRGSTGFGLEHRNAGDGEWGQKMQDDLTDAVEFFTRKGTVDPNRICIAGASYGGYAALAGAAFTPDLYKCAFSLAGVSHIPDMLSADERLYGADSHVMSYFKLTIGGGQFDSKALESISPYFFAKNVRAPVMLVHGEDDKIVAFEQSEQMHSALKEAGADVELVKLRDEDHYLQEQETRIQAVRALVGFVDKHIGSRAAESPAESPVSSTPPAAASLSN